MQFFATFSDRYRWPVLIIWIAIVAVGAIASSGLNDLLSNRFDIPDTESDKALSVLTEKFGHRGDSAFLIIAKDRTAAAVTPATIKSTAAAAKRAGVALGDAHVGTVNTSGPLAYVAIGTTKEQSEAQQRVPAMRAAIGTLDGVDIYLSGQTAINRDLQPVVDADLVRGLKFTIPIAIIVLLFIFGTVISTLVPLAFALATVPTTLGIVWIAAHQINMAIYVTNLVELIGIGIAIDYSLLVVYRFREEMLAIQRRKLGDVEGDARHVRLSRDEIREALDPTMRFAGHAVVFSGLTVAVALAGLVLVPVPFIRSLGVGSLVIPLISIAAAVTLLPAILSIVGVWLARGRVVPRRVLEGRADNGAGFWVRLSTTIMARPWPFLLTGSAILVALAIPTLWISLTPGSNKGLPTQSESVQGLQLMDQQIGAGAMAPTTIIIDTGRPGGVWEPAQVAAIKRLATELRADAAIAAQATAVTTPADLLDKGDAATAHRQAVATGLVDLTGQYGVAYAASQQEYGSEQAQGFARRIRSTLVPSADFPTGTTVLVGGAPAASVDFIDQVYGSFIYLIIAVLAVSYLLLVRAFRSLLLPLKAVILNALSVSAAYGVLVMVFQFGWGEWAGIAPTGQIEAWIPIFLFAMLFGLSMDYEVFLVTRMREFYDSGCSNEQAVAQGLQRTGRIVSAAAIILVAAFAGFLLGSLAGFQQFGLGLSVGILIDATLIRMLLVPAFMRVAGDINWWLPDRIAWILRVEPSRRRATPDS